MSQLLQQLLIFLSETLPDVVVQWAPMAKAQAHAVEIQAQILYEEATWAHGPIGDAIQGAVIFACFMTMTACIIGIIGFCETSKIREERRAVRRSTK